MTDEPKPVANYKPNSQKARINEEIKIEKVVAQVTTNPVIEKKKSLGAKFRESFAGDDAQSVGSYLIMDVVIPATKNLIFDMLSEGARRILFGSAGGGGRAFSSSLVNNGRTAYNKVYNVGASPRSQDQQFDKVAPSNDIPNIIMQTRGEAEMVLESLIALVDQYSSASKADLYATVGRTASHTDTKFGWTNLSTASVQHIREGYMLVLPRLVAL